MLVLLTRQEKEPGLARRGPAWEDHEFGNGQACSP